MPEGLIGYVIDYESKESISFLYFDDIDGGPEPQYDEQPVRGRSEEHIFYSHTTAEAYNFRIHLHASVDESDRGTTRQNYKNYLFVKSFAYPDYGVDTKGPLLPPRKAIITIGEFFRKTGVIKAPTASFKRPFDENGYPHIIEVGFTFRVIHSRPLDLHDIRAGL